MPLPNAQLLSADIIASGGNTIFTVATAGRYRLSYAVNTTAALVAGTRLIINAVPNIASTISPVLSVASYSNEILLDLAAGNTVTLQMFGILSASTLQSGAAGATLMIVRLS